MSEHTPQPSPVEASWDNIGSLLDDTTVIAEPAAEPTPTPEPTPEPATPTQPDPIPAATLPVVAPEEVVATLPNQQEVGRAFKALNEEKRALELENARLKAVAEERARVAQPAAAPAPVVDEDPKPNPADFTDDQVYLDACIAHGVRQGLKTIRAELAPVAATQAEQQVNASLGAVETQLGKDAFARTYAAVQALAKAHPAIGQQIIQAGANAGTEFLRIAATIPGLLVAGQQPAAAPTPTPPGELPPDLAALNGLPPAEREAALKAIAASRAAAGTPAPTPSPSLGPLGLGSTPASSGAVEAATVIDRIKSSTNRAQLDELAREAYADM